MKKKVEYEINEIEGNCDSSLYEKPLITLTAVNLFNFPEKFMLIKSIWKDLLPTVLEVKKSELGPKTP